MRESHCHCYCWKCLVIYSWLLLKMPSYLVMKRLKRLQMQARKEVTSEISSSSPAQRSKLPHRWRLPPIDDDIDHLFSFWIDSIAIIGHQWQWYLDMEASRLGYVLSSDGHGGVREVKGNANAGAENKTDVDCWFDDKTFESRTRKQEVPPLPVHHQRQLRFLIIVVVIIL